MFVALLLALASPGLALELTTCTVCHAAAVTTTYFIYPTVEDAILELLRPSCNHLTDPVMKDDCIYLVESEVHFFIQLVLDNMNPDFLCSLVHLCPQYADPLDEIKCTICSFATELLFDVISYDATRDQLTHLLQIMCERLPDKTCQDRCTAFFSDNLVRLMDTLLVTTTPEEICRSFNLCEVR